MHEIACAACGLPVPSYDIVHYGAGDGTYRKLCGRCFNTEVAETAGLHDFQHARFEPIRMADASGRPHEFRFRVHLFGSGVAIDAFEVRDGTPGGYQFQVIGDPESDLLALLGKLVEKMRRALSIRHVEDGPCGVHITAANVVRATLQSATDDDHESPSVVIDGQEFSWADFGRMLSAFEGWQFKLEIRDRSDEV